MNYSAVNSKAQAIYAKNIKSKPQLKILSEGSREAAIKKLNEVLEVDISNYNLYEINKFMETKNYNILKSFVHYLSAEDREFYKFLLSRYQIIDIKRIFRTIVHNEDIQLLKDSLISFDSEFLLSDSDLNIDSFMKMLIDSDASRKSNYGRRLMVYKDIPKDKILFYIEMTLDQSYYEDLIKKSKKIKGKNSDIAQRLIGIHIDILNIIYIYRGKKTYSISPEELENFIIDGGYKFSKNFLKSLAYEDMNYFMKEIRGSDLDFLFSENREVDNIDIRVNRYLYEVFDKAFVESKLDIAKIISMSILLELTLRDISAVLEGKRLGLNTATIRSLLTIPTGSGEIWQ